jgi:hypothetical protein
MTSFGATSHRTNFETGWTKYVKPPLYPAHPVPPDVFWNPRKGGWYTYTSALFDIQDKALPKVDLSALFETPSNVYDKASDQYNTLPVDVQPAALWDPRRGQWMSVHSRTGSPPPPRPPLPPGKTAACG